MRRAWVWGCLGSPLLIFIALPVIALGLRVSLQDLFSQIASEEVRSAMWVTLRTTTTSCFLLISFGTPLAWAIATMRPRLAQVLEMWVTFPAILPPSVAGIALLLAFGRLGFLGPTLSRLHINVPFTAVAVIMAQLFVAVPFYLRPAASAFRSIDGHLFEAAVLDGAGPWHTLTKITLPLVQRQLLAGASLAWARALGEFGATILFAGNRLGETRTMPLAIYLGFETDFDQAITLSVLMLIIAGAVLVFGVLLTRGFRGDVGSKLPQNA